MNEHIKVADVEVDPRHFIGGERVEGASTFDVFSPIDQSPLGAVSAGDTATVDRAVQAARAAFPAWAALGPDGRGAVLDRFARGIRDAKERLSIVETTDNGSILIANQKRVVDRAAHNVSFFSDFARRLNHEPVVEQGVSNHTRHEPAGVAALITPWNAPLMLSTWKVGPALAAGNTVVLKPPEWSPLTCSLLADIAREAGVPPGVFNVVQGLGSEAGQALVDHKEVARLSFTGSVATGMRVGATAGGRITPASLELGGKSPFVVFADADLDAAAETVAMQFNNAGQVCFAGTRVLVESAIADEFRAKVVKASGAYCVGDPRERGVRVGPLIHPRQFERVSGLVSRACAAGAEPILGGGPDDRGGLYFKPTILAGVEQESEIVQNEVFGPVLSWQTFGDESEAIELANGTDYGLAAVVFTGDESRADRAAAAIVAGTVWVNCYLVRHLEVPFGGARISGLGREGGIHSFDFFCDVKNVAKKQGTFGGRRG